MTSSTPSILYPTIVADPPWPYKASGNPWLEHSEHTRPHSWRRSGPALTKHYQPMSIQAMQALEVPAADNAHLYLWTTNAFMVEAHEVARSWGFEPKTICTWVKMRSDDSCRPSMATGFYFRGATEHVGSPGTELEFAL